MKDDAVGHHVGRSVPPLVPAGVRPKTEWPPTKVLRHLPRAWVKPTPSTRFLIVCVLLICAIMLHIGAWLDGRIRQSVAETAASALAHHMEGLIHPYLQDLATSQELSEPAKATLAGLINPSSRQAVLEVNIWLRDGRPIYSSRKGDLPSPAHRVATELTRAAAGQISVHIETDKKFVLPDRPDAAIPVFNVFAPIRDSTGTKVVAIAEFFQDASTLIRESAIARRHSWLVIGGLTAGMLAILFVIVRRSSNIIKQQQHALQLKVEEQEGLLRQNERLRTRLSHAHQSSHLVSDKILRRISADLHDGPAQLLALALLRLDEFAPTPAGPNDGTSAFDTVRTATQDALSEIRSISTGLALPQIEPLDARQTLEFAVTSHERRTFTKVACSISPEFPPNLPLPIRVGLFRAVQEGLNNSFHHAGGQGQSVFADFDGSSIQVTVKDTGPGFTAASIKDEDNALGLVGLKHRVESFGGSLKIQSLVGKGTTIAVSVPYREAA